MYLSHKRKINAKRVAYGHQTFKKKSLTRAATPDQKRKKKIPASNTQTTSEEDRRPPMTPTHTAGFPPLVTLRIGDAAAYRTGEEPVDAKYRKTATNKGTSGPVTAVRRLQRYPKGTLPWQPGPQVLLIGKLPTIHDPQK
jgi:hypothetical protein